MSSILKLPEMPYKCKHCMCESNGKCQALNAPAMNNSRRNDCPLQNALYLADNVEDAEFIVTAVNSHDALVARNAELGEALQTCLSAIKFAVPGAYGMKFEKLEQLLKKEG